MAYEVMVIAGYWRLMKNRTLVSTHQNREAAITAMTAAKISDNIKSIRKKARAAIRRAKQAGG